MSRICWDGRRMIVVGTELRLAEGSASAQPSMCPCSIKRCQFPRASACALTINKALFTAFYESVSVLPYRSNKLASLLTSPHSAGSYTAFSMLRVTRFSFAVRASNALLIVLVFPSCHQSTLCAQAGLMRSFSILVCW